MAEIIGRVGWRNFVPTENPLWDNLKAYFTGDNTANDSKGTNNGTLVNGATYGTGKIGSGFSLDGINDYVGFSSTWFRKSKTEPFTISSWVNSSVHYGAIFSNGVDDGHLAFIYGQYIYLQMGAGLYGSIRVVSASTIPLNTFKHITITYNGNCTLSGFKIYIDGVSVGVNIAQGEYGPLNNLASNDTPAIASIPRIGARCDGAYPFAGVLDEVGIWDRALTGAEVTELYNVGAGKQYVAPAPTIVTNSNAFPTSNLFAYSFRKVVPTATLSFRVRRSSDNAEQNIGFVGNDLDTTSLLSFVGAGNGFVVKMYNQVSSTSTAGNDLVQTYASAQFQIVVSGVVNTLNGKPSCTTGNGKYMLTTTLFNPSVITGASIFSVTKPIGQIGGEYGVDWIYSIGNGSLGTDRFLDHHISGASGNPTTYNQSVESALSNISTPYTSGTKFQSHLIKSGSNKYYQNNVLVGSNTTALVTPGSGHRLVINNISWSVGTTSFANQYFSEILVYNSDETSNLETIHNNISSYYTPAYTARTTAFAAATGITDATILNALNTFDTGLISNGLDTKMKALYPMVGGTANTHKYNFMDARDSDAAFRLQLNGGWVHSSTGTKPNGTNAYANTFYNQITQGDNVNSGHLSYYSRTNSNGAEVEIGSGGGAYTLLEIRTAGVTYPLINQSGLTSFADADSLGFYIANRTASNVVNGWKSGVKKVSGTTTSTFVTYNNICIGGLITTNYTTKECAFASIGSGLTDSEASALSTLVQTMQTSLSRQV